MTSLNKHTNLFTKSGCLNFEAIKIYAFEETDNSTKEKIMAHISRCEMCRDAIEGFTILKDREVAENSVSNIHKKIDNKTYTQDSTKIINVSFIKRAMLVSAAASIALLIGYFAMENHIPVLNQQEIMQCRTLGDKIQDIEQVNYYTILGNDSTDTQDTQENNKLPKIEKKAVENIQASTYKKTRDKLAKEKYIVKNDILIRESQEAEFLTPIDYKFDDYVQKRMDSLIGKSNMPYHVTAEFIVNKNGEVKKPRILFSSRDDLNKITVEALVSSPRWKPATINNTPIDYPVKINIIRQ